MEHIARLAAAVDALRVVDGYQYVAATRQPLALPSDIRFIIRRRPASRLGAAVHDQYTLVIALRGAAWVVLDRHRIRLQEGEALLIHPGQVHDYADREPEAEVFWLFCGFHLGHEPRFTALASAPVALTARVADDIKALLDDHFLAIGFGKRHTPPSERLVALRLLLALEQLDRQRADDGRPDAATGADGAPEALGDTSHPFVQRVVTHVREHLADPLSIAGIARALHLSTGHLRNEFHRLAGVGIGRYIRTARIRHACILLDTTDLPLAEIGRRCGYESTFSFSRAFKGDKGIPPTAYRASFKPVK